MRDPVDIAFGAAVLAAALFASGHAVIYKRESRSAALWVVLIWVMPALGPILYMLMGVNRVQRRAVRMRAFIVRHRADPQAVPGEPAGTHLAPLARMLNNVVERPLLDGNAVETLVDGAQAYPAMLQAIESARASLMLASYIFDSDGIGAEFVAALERAHKRGVAVRVLVDDVDVRFSRRPVTKPLRRAGVPVGVFNPPFVPARLNAVHLRNHRKILVVDGTVGFTGGMNIDGRYWAGDAASAGKEVSRDLHFRLQGPVVAQLAEVFADDWQFVTGEALRGAPWFVPLEAAGNVLARCIDDGPDESTRAAALGDRRRAEPGAALGAHHDALLRARRRAGHRARRRRDARRRRRHRAARAQRPAARALGGVGPALAGARARLPASGAPRGLSTTPSCMVVDGAWTLLGSANWDARSLRLNFELNVECYSVEFGAHMEGLMLARINAAQAGHALGHQRTLAAHQAARRHRAPVRAVSIGGNYVFSALYRMRWGLAASSPRRFFLSASYSW